jgi:hypothetical protein
VNIDRPTFATGIHTVVVGRGIVGERNVEEHTLHHPVEHRRHDLGHVFRMPGERHLRAVPQGSGFQRFTTMEIMVEPDESYSRVPMVQIVFDILGNE